MPELGDFGVVRTSGWAAKLIRWGTQSPVNHAFVYVGNGEIVEMEPKTGATLSKASKYKTVYWSTGKIPLTFEQRKNIALFERGRVGRVRYSLLGLVVIAFAQRRLGSLITSNSWIAKKVGADGEEFCSQEVDYAYDQNGVHLFKDGRLPGLVSPGDLYELIK